jgi:hypothetical protein
MKKKNKTEEFLEVDDRLTLSPKKGNGILRRQVWFNAKQEVTRYSLAYINHRLFLGDNGRVIGYDNNHGTHHKHYMGQIESVEFTNFAEIEERFQREFEAIHETFKKK